MNRTMLVLMAGLLLMGGVGEVSAQDNETTPEVEDRFDYEPILVLVVLAAVVFAIAKYGP